MLVELLEQGHRQQVRAGEAAQRHVERRVRLGDRLTGPAGELLAHVRIALHCRGTTASVSVMSSPSFDSRFEPQQGQLARWPLALE